MYRKENSPPANDVEEPLVENEKRQEIDINDPSISEELRNIYYQEKYHITPKRSVFIVVNLGILIAVQTIYKNKDIDKNIRYGTAIIFAILMIVMTYTSVREVDNIHKIKNSQGYKFDS